MKIKIKHYKFVLYLINLLVIVIIALFIFLSFQKNLSFFISLKFIIILLILLFLNIFIFKKTDEKRLDEAIEIGRKKRENFTKIAGTLAHEIRNPLSTILVNIDLLKERINQKKYDEFWFNNKINTLKKEVVRLNEIVENFLDIARGKKLQFKKCIINKIIEEISSLEIDKVNQINNNIKFRIDLCDYDLIVYCDEVQLKQALLNLIKNAEEALDESGGGEIILKCFEKNKKANIYIIDTGKGISNKQLEKIFEVYYTTKQKGNGLGIPVANRIIEQHGGIMKINSYENKGTFIEISLPIGKQETLNDNN
jgi:nitrogen fixation/metabolism regulation signal transduction histidine kinase